MVLLLSSAPGELAMFTGTRDPPQAAGHHGGETARADRVAALISSTLFSHGPALEDTLPYEERAILSVRRAQALVKAYSTSFYSSNEAALLMYSNV